MTAQVNKDLCHGCGDCEKICPVSAIHLENAKAIVDPNTCIDCGACVSVCPYKAIKLV